jgi:hypothetical protein
MPDHSKFATGKLPARVDPNTLCAVDYVGAVLPAPRGQINYISAVEQYPMYDNDKVGDCAIAAIGHLVQWWSALTGRRNVPPVEEIRRVYSILSPNNNGCVLLDVLNYWTSNPICGVQIGAFAAVNPRNQEEFEVCMDIYGGLYVGAELPIAAQNQEVFDVGKGADFAYGSWGGHCIPFGRYGQIGSRGPAFVSWGKVMECTWPWVQTYVSEAYALISAEWLDPRTGEAPSGFSAEALNADLRILVAQP